MKYSLDFITNSSSESFICNICGNTESGWDLCRSDAEFHVCDEGHEFCMYHLHLDEIKNRINELGLNFNDICKKINEDYDLGLDDSLNEEDYYFKNFDELMERILDYSGDIPTELCPICLGIYIDDEIKLKFLLKKYNENIDKITSDIQMLGDLDMIKKTLKED